MLAKREELGGESFHANENLDATALQRTIVRLSASVSTPRSSVLTLGESALKCIPEKAMEPNDAWEQTALEELIKPATSRKVKGQFMLPAKSGSELDLQPTATEGVAYLHRNPFAEGAMLYASHLWWYGADCTAWHLVVKESKFEGAYDTPKAIHAFLLKNHRRAQELVTQFKSRMKQKKESEHVKVKFTPAYVARLSDPEYIGFRFVICEKFIPGHYVTFNANNGWVNTEAGKQEDGKSRQPSAISHSQVQWSAICVTSKVSALDRPIRSSTAKTISSERVTWAKKA